MYDLVAACTVVKVRNYICAEELLLQGTGTVVAGHRCCRCCAVRTKVSTQLFVQPSLSLSLCLFSDLTLKLTLSVPLLSASSRPADACDSSNATRLMCPIRAPQLPDGSVLA